MNVQERLAHYRLQRERALEAVRDMDEGRIKHYDLTPDGSQRIDVTADWRELQNHTAEQLAHMIAAWEQHDA